MADKRILSRLVIWDESANFSLFLQSFFRNIDIADILIEVEMRDDA
ncbi:hypothetical protein [Arcanobacterium bovis]|nr:hypothetical protein [Arcanobacterium bovis]